jgi:hypothetical protein
MLAMCWRERVVDIVEDLDDAARYSDRAGAPIEDNLCYRAARMIERLRKLANVGPLLEPAPPDTREWPRTSIGDYHAEELRDAMARAASPLPRT